MSTDEKATGPTIKDVKKRIEEMPLERPADGKPHIVKIQPYKSKLHRMALSRTFRKGQGVTMNGWQFQIRTIQGNGTIYLKPVGKIIEEPKETEPKKRDKPN